MQIKYNKTGARLNIYFFGELDDCSASKSREIIDNILDNNGGIREVVFNFSSMTFMDSTGIGMLIGRYKKLKSKNIDVYLQSPTPSVEKILEISGLYRIMPKI